MKVGNVINWILPDTASLLWVLLSLILVEVVLVAWPKKTWSTGVLMGMACGMIALRAVKWLVNNDYIEPKKPIKPVVNNEPEPNRYCTTWSQRGRL